MKKLRPMLAMLSFAVLAGSVSAAKPGEKNYLVRFNRVPGQAEAAMINGLGGSVHRQFSIVPAFAVSLPEQAAV